MDQETLINKLTQDNLNLQSFAAGLHTLSSNELEAKSSGGWSVLDCLHHMNISMEVYLEQIEPKLIPPLDKKKSNFKTSWIAAYFAKGMEPTTDGQLKNKMKTFKKLDPILNEVKSDVLKQFEQNIKRTLQIIQQIEQKNLRAFKVKTALGPILKFYLGDSIWFYTAHNLRHMHQIQNIIHEHHQ
ncbi:DinB family protein [Fulvivirga ligni]|uniref:DinB family protein n=1 Tax=Fulvivirga ligni TaxID=2904246 RepID=UPI001F362B14|nr:DinB family protein [Fulvivirga ligni]UII22421.1 DinB family protein [Fulvivirga ligni]